MGSYLVNSFKTSRSLGLSQDAASEGGTLGIKTDR